MKIDVRPADAVIPLPEAFLERMEKMLGEEYPAFLAEYEDPAHSAFRVNPLKVAEPEQFAASLDFAMERVPWEKNAWYYDAAVSRPGKSALHEAGAYYIQEPSAAAVVPLLDPQPGERVLDLCAAPGGKSTQIAAAMQGKGLLVSNEIHPQRAKILSQNIERMGVRNAIVLNETPERLAYRLGGTFDRVLTDAPCSGEGMFRRDPEARTQWSPENVAMCADRQDRILDCAADLVKNGGLLVYSTCTFSPEEDEGSVRRFLERHPEFHLEPPKSVADGVLCTEGMLRLYPHKVRGEGHFAAALRKDGTLRSVSAQKRKKRQQRSEAAGYAGSLAEAFPELEEMIGAGVPVLFGQELYLMPEDFDLAGLTVLRPGLHLASVKKGRIEPAHALAMALTPGRDLASSIDDGQDPHGVKNAAGGIPSIELDEETALRYLRGETIDLSLAGVRGDGKPGWTLVTTRGVTAGWGKSDGRTLKNHYPKGLRLK